MAEQLTYRRAVASLDMPASRYVLVVVLPVLLLTVAGATALQLILPRVFSGLWRIVPWSVPLVATFFVLYYPLQRAQAVRSEMDHNMHYFITHLGVLATSDVPRVDFFEALGNREEYGTIAEECEKIATLVKQWNMSLAEACRFVARRTPSLIFSDFLERFAFAVDSGADMEDYLRNEQEVVMSDYESIYQKGLENLGNLDSLYNGLIMTSIFLVLFALLMPVLVGGSSVRIMFIAVLLTFVVQVGFLVLVRGQTPTDPVWQGPVHETRLLDDVKWAIPLALVASLAAGPLLHLHTDLETPLVLALASTPLAVPGIIAGRSEAGVKRRDDNYPAFVRSLGASSSARSGDEREVLKHLRHHDFGPLSDDIEALFARLQLRIDDEAAWKHFVHDTGSMLVERFTQMYDEAVDAGGRPKAIGGIISDNMVDIVNLRKLRYQKAGTFRGTLLGAAGAMAFSLFIGVGVLEMLTGLFETVSVSGDAPVALPTLIHTSGVNIPLMTKAVLVLLMVNAATSSLMIRFVDGGSTVRAFQDYPLFVWVSMLVALAAIKVLEKMLGTNVVA